MKTDWSSLGKLYKRIGIEYRIPQQVYLLGRQKQIQVNQQRADFAVYLARVLSVEKREVVYIDETTFNFHMRNRRCWSYRDELVSKPISNQRFSGVTLFGGIGKCLKHSVFMTAESTSSNSFQQFIQALCTSIKDGAAKPLLLMDNHSSHYDRSTNQMLANSFDVIRIPPYSCQFNSIETLWGIIKLQFRKQVALQLANIKSQAQLNDLVLQTALKIPKRIADNVSNCNRDYILKWLWKRKQGIVHQTLH